MADLAKVRRNVARMVEQSAPEADIDAYLSSEGTTPDALRAFGEAGAPEPWRRKDDASGVVNAFRTLFSLRPGGGLDRVAEAVNAPPRDVEIPRLEEAPSGPARYAHTFRNALIPGGNRLAAASTATINMLRGEDGTWSDAYDRALTGEFARSQAIDNNKGLADHAAVAGGLLGGVALTRRLPGMAPRPYIGAPRSANAELAANTADVARAGAGYGMVQGYLDSHGRTPDARAADAVAGLFGGAAVGSLLPVGANALSTAVGAGRNALQRVTGTTPEARAMNRARREELESIGINDPSGPAIADGAIAGGAARGLAGSVLGQPVAQAVERDVIQAQNAVRAPLLERSGGAPVSDNLAATQQMLRRNLTERSLSEADLARMSRAELEAMTGPVNDATGFRPPRPVVDPTPPVYPAPVDPRVIDPTTVRVQPVRPKPVSDADAERLVTLDQVPVPPAQAAAIERARRARAELQAVQQAEESRFQAAFDAHVGGDPERARQTLAALDAELAFRRQPTAAPRPAAWTDSYPEPPARVTQNVPKHEPPPLWDWYERLMGIRDQVGRSDAMLQRAITQGDEARVARLPAEQRRVYDQFVRRSEEEAARLTQDRHRDAVAQREVKARTAAEQETLSQRRAAEAAAQTDTRRRQIAADRDWEAQPGGFAYGRSRETYPTEYGAAEEVVARLTPPFQRNPLGGAGPSGSRTATATETLLDDMAREMRASNKLPGYPNGGVIDSGRAGSGGVRGEITPDLAEQLKTAFGNDIAGRLMSYHASRMRGQLTGKVEGLRGLITDVRRAAQDAERGDRLFPGQPRNAESAALRRLEGALNNDLYRFMREAGPSGQVAADMTRDIRQSYAQHLEDVRRPLAQLFGSRERPVDTMQAANTLASALRDGDMTVVRPFMQVLREKGREGEAGRAVATILQHMSGFDGRNGRLVDFLSTMRSLRPDVRRELSSTPQSRELMRHLERLEAIVPRLAEFERRLPGQGEDLTRQVARMMANGGNWAHLGLWAMGNWPTALVAAGGTHALARFMGSPRYVDWLTRMERVRSPSQLQDHLRRLAIVAGNDAETGAPVLNAVNTLLSSTAQAAPLLSDARPQSKDGPVLVTARNGPANDLPSQSRDDGPETNPTPRTLLSGLARVMGAALTPELRSKAESLLATDDFLAGIEALDAMPLEERRRLVPGFLQRLRDQLGETPDVRP